MNNFKIASILTKLDWNEEEEILLKEWIVTISKDEELQLYFFEYCKKWKLAPWVFTQLTNHSLIDAFSKNVQTLFAEVYNKTKHENERRNQEAVRFLKAFKDNNIDVIVLKGNVFAHTVYKDVGYKKMNDFDILIKQQDWEKAQNCYLQLGFIPLGFGWSGEKQKAAKFSHVGMSFISSDYSCIIGTQWGLKSPTTGFKVPIEEAWLTAKPFDFEGVLVKQLSAEFNLLHLILHMGVFKCGIRDCMDVYNLLHTNDIDERNCIDLLQRSNAIDKAFFTLSLSNICSESLGNWLQKLTPNTNSFIIRRLHKRLGVHERTGDFQNSYNDYFQDIEKVVIYFNLFPEFHKKLYFYLKILRLIYFPKTDVTLKLCDCTDKPLIINKLIARLKAPYLVFSLIAQEIGWTFTFLLFIKLLFDLIGSIKNYFIKKESYFDYLKKQGIDPKSIEKVVKNIQ